MLWAVVGTGAAEPTRRHLLDCLVLRALGLLLVQVLLDVLRINQCHNAVQPPGQPGDPQQPMEPAPRRACFVARWEIAAGKFESCGSYANSLMLSSMKNVWITGPGSCKPRRAVVSERPSLHR